MFYKIVQQIYIIFFPSEWYIRNDLTKKTVTYVHTSYIQKVAGRNTSKFNCTNRLSDVHMYTSMCYIHIVNTGRSLKGREGELAKLDESRLRSSGSTAVLNPIATKRRVTTAFVQTAVYIAYTRKKLFALEVTL